MTLTPVVTVGSESPPTWSVPGTAEMGGSGRTRSLISVLRRARPKSPLKRSNFRWQAYGGTTVGVSDIVKYMLRGEHIDGYSPIYQG